MRRLIVGLVKGHPQVSGAIKQAEPNGPDSAVNAPMPDRLVRPLYRDAPLVSPFYRKGGQPHSAGMNVAKAASLHFTGSVI